METEGTPAKQTVTTVTAEDPKNSSLRLAAAVRMGHPFCNNAFCWFSGVFTTGLSHGKKDGHADLRNTAGVTSVPPPPWCAWVAQQQRYLDAPTQPPSCRGPWPLSQRYHSHFGFPILFTSRQQYWACDPDLSSAAGFPPKAIRRVGRGRAEPGRAYSLKQAVERQIQAPNDIDKVTEVLQRTAASG